MAFDAWMMRATLAQFNESFPEAKIEKVLQPVGDEIDLAIHHGKRSGRLLFNVGPNAPRLQLTSKAKENPIKAPTFCMFLRKRLLGARITDARQIGFDRIAQFTIAGYDEMGFATEMKIICEIMGKYANFILLDGEDKIISALKMIDFSESSIRQILPGLKYTAPECQSKLIATEVSREELLSALSSFGSEKTLEKFITSTFSGVATQIARELTYRTAGDIDVPVSGIDKERFSEVFSQWQDILENHRYTPTVAYDKSGKPIDYSYMDITYLGADIAKRTFPTLAELMDEYFYEKDRLEKIHQRAHDVKRLLANSKSRIEKKLSIQRETLIESEKAENYRRLGDLITSNIYRIKKSDTKLIAVDYYDENTPQITIELDPRLSPSQNAQRMYKQYAKLKTAKAVLTEQISIWEKELLYLESVSAFLEAAESEQDIADIREELYSAGYSSRMKGYRPQKKAKNEPHKFRTTDGMVLLVGKNNLQNDSLTHKIADKNDIWFHVKDIPGSHVILVTDGKEPTDRDYTEAAEIAAGYSKATGDLVAVDYTRVKNVKKPQGSKPGFVTYKTNYTAFVKPRKSI